MDGGGPHRRPHPDVGVCLFDRPGAAARRGSGTHIRDATRRASATPGPFVSETSGTTAMIRRFTFGAVEATVQRSELYRVVCTGLLGSSLIAVAALALGAVSAPL